MGRRRKNEDESSLDLLLDTMCNTFGGVMFIAIALAVMSFFIPKQTKDENKDNQCKEQQATLADELLQQQTKIEELRQSKRISEEALKSAAENPNSELLEERLDIQSDKKRLELQRQLLAASINKRQLEINEAYKQNRQLEKELKDFSKSKKTKQEEAEIELVKQKKKLDLLQMELAQLETRELIFSKLEAEEAKSPFWIMIDNGRLYRISQEKGTIWKDGKLFNVSPDVSYTFDQSSTKLQLKSSLSGGTLVKRGMNLDQLFSPVPNDKRFIFALVKADDACFKCWINTRAR